MSKICIKCKETKDLNLFTVNKDSKDGRHSFCKECFKIYNKQRYADKKAQINEQALNYYKQNKDKRKEYKIQNKEVIKSKTRIYVQKNLDYFMFKNAYRRALKRNATPSWITKDQLQSIRKIYKEAKNKEIQTGFKWHVDHIIPLNGSNVCGLHVPWNLQLLPAEQNLSKGNKVF
jgi:hypothetical protein